MQVLPTSEHKEQEKDSVAANNIAILSWALVRILKVLPLNNRQVTKGQVGKYQKHVCNILRLLSLSSILHE